MLTYSKEVSIAGRIKTSEKSVTKKGKINPNNVYQCFKQPWLHRVSEKGILKKNTNTK